MKKSLAELAEFLGECQLHGNENLEIEGICSAANTKRNCITFATSPKWIKQLDASKVGAVIVKEQQADESLNQIVHASPYLAFIRIVELFHSNEHEHTGISGSADIAADAALGSPLTVEAHVVIGSRVAMGNGCVLEAGCRIGPGAVIGENCHLHANVVIEKDCVIGNNVIIHAGTVVGADGFGYLQHNGRNMKVPQVGKVVIGNNVEIGANCCIDRGTIDDTVLGNGVVLDNLVQIGHNVVIGDNAVIVAQVGLAGSSSVGAGAMLGGKAGATEHVKIGDGALLAAQAIATREIKPGTMVAGNPAVEIEIWRRSKVIARKLPSIWTKLQKIIRESE